MIKEMTRRSRNLGKFRGTVVLQISSDGDDRRILLALKSALVLGFSGIGKFGKYCIGWLDLRRDFLGVFKTISRFVVANFWTRDFLGVLIFSPIRSSPSLEIRSTLPDTKCYTLYLFYILNCRISLEIKYAFK